MSSEASSERDFRASSDRLKIDILYVGFTSIVGEIKFKFVMSSCDWYTADPFP